MVNSRNVYILRLVFSLSCANVLLHNICHLETKLLNGWLMFMFDSQIRRTISSVKTKCVTRCRDFQVRNYFFLLNTFPGTARLLQWVVFLVSVEEWDQLSGPTPQPDAPCQLVLLVVNHTEPIGSLIRLEQWCHFLCVNSCWNHHCTTRAWWELEQGLLGAKMLAEGWFEIQTFYITSLTNRRVNNQYCWQSHWPNTQFVSPFLFSSRQKVTLIFLFCFDVFTFHLNTQFGNSQRALIEYLSSSLSMFKLLLLLPLLLTFRLLLTG